MLPSLSPAATCTTIVVSVPCFVSELSDDFFINSINLLWPFATRTLSNFPVSVSLIFLFQVNVCLRIRVKKMFACLFNLLVFSDN